MKPSLNSCNSFVKKTFFKTFKITLLSFFLVSCFIVSSYLFAEDGNKQVMSARERARIVSTAKALFEPQVKNSLKIGRVQSPFSAPSTR
jgi:hypothetical protein